MAKDEIVIKLRVEDGDLKISSANIDKHSKKLDKNTKKKDQGTKASNRFNKAEKGLYQTNLSGSKAFSKMNQTMGGSSGLVAAYATLAANVFAATAAFGALQRAAQFEQLKKGLTELGQQSGRTLSVMAEGLREVTGGAISVEEAMRAAALGVSGGFGGEQLAGLAKIARGASITLGRSLPDAFDRLTRGAIKLEPEILDELGIMVRLDDAVENYGAQIGKAGSALTQMERRQAFMNAILEQGESKFGEIAEAVEPDAYSRLGATFTDLTNAIFNFFNQKFVFGFFGLNEIVGFLADNVFVLFGVMTLFASTIAGKMIPALASGAAGAQHMAEKAARLAGAANIAKVAHLELMEASLNTAGAKVSENYANWAKGLANSKDKMGDLNKMQKSLNASIRFQEGIVKTGSAAEKKAALDNIALMKLEQAQLNLTTQAEMGRGAAGVAAANATALATAESAVALEIIKLTNKEQKMGATWKAIGAATKTYTDDLTANSKALKSNSLLVRLNAKGMIFLRGAIFKARKALGLLKISLIELLLPIAAIIIAIGVFWALWNWKNNTKEQKKYNEGVKQLDTLIDEMPEKVEKYNKALDNSKNLADGQLRAFEISSGIITEMNDKLREQVRLRKEADDSGGKKEKLGRGKLFQFLETEGIGDVVGMKGDQLIKEFGFDPAFFDGLDNAKKAVKGVLSVGWSDELKVASAILKTGIPDQADMLAMKLGDVFQSGVGPEEMVKAIHKAIGEVENAFGNLGPAAKGIRDALKEAEKEGSKFLNTFARKTSVDMFAKSTATAVKSIMEMEKTVTELQAAAMGKDGKGIKLDITVDEVVGKSLLDVGSKMAAMIGPDFVLKQKALRDSTRDLDKAIKEGATGDELTGWRDKVKAAAEELGRMKQEVFDLNTAVLETQRLELTRKQTLVGINKVIKFASKNYKLNAKLAGIEAKMTLKKLKFEQLITKSKIAQVKKMFEEISYIEAKRDEETGEMKDVQTRISQEDFLAMTLAEQQAIIEKTNLTQQNLFSLLGSITEEKLQQLDIDKEIETLGTKQALQKAEAYENQLNMVKKIRAQEDKGFKLAAQKESFLAGRGTTLNAAEEAKLKIQAAERAFEFAIFSAKVENAIIDAKALLQKADMKYLDKQIEVLNQRTKLEKGEEFDPKMDLVDRIDLEGGAAAIDAMADLQKIAVQKNVENLQSSLEIALFEGLESFKEGVEKGEINLFKGLKGSQDAFEKLEGLGDLELAETKTSNELLRELIDKWDKATASNELGVHIIEDETTLSKAEQREIKILAKQAAREAKIQSNQAARAAKQAGKEADRMGKAGYSTEKESGWEWLMKKVKSDAGDGTVATVDGVSLIDILHAESEAFVANTAAVNNLNTTLTTGGGNGGSGVIEEIEVTAQKRPVVAAETAIEEIDMSTIPEKKGVPPIEPVITYTKALHTMRMAQAGFTEEAMKWGPEGEAFAGMMEGFLGENGLVVSIKAFADSTGGMMEKLSLAGDVISSMGSIMASSSKMMVAQIDNQIKAEKAKDGSSKESLARIKTMEAKKLAIQKKAFETKKKMSIAKTMINIVTSVVQAWEEYGWPWGAVLGAIIAGMGMKQISMIKSQQFEGGSGAVDAGSTPSVSVGKRSNKVDVSQRASAGELAFLRGERGIGQQATSFSAQGGAAGMRKGYASGGEILVGERGPETITPLTGLNVIPADQGMKNVVNASFTIHAIDAQGVEEVLLGQQGNIISMIRTAANDYGQDFLEGIDTTTYGEPQSEGGVDY